MGEKRRLPVIVAGMVVAVAGVVAVGYGEVAHMVDPCVRGWWDERSQIGSQPLCERFGTESNWNTRFHLLAHAIPAAALLGVYVWAVHRWARTPPEEDARPAVMS